MDIYQLRLLFLPILFLMLSGGMKAIADVIKFHWKTSTLFSGIGNTHWFYKWAGPNSWKNKWKNGDKNQGERFLGSSTVFVWMVSGWHLFDLLNTLFGICVYTFSVLYIPIFYMMSFVYWDFEIPVILFRIIDTLIFFGIFSTTFEIIFRKI